MNCLQQFYVKHDRKIYEQFNIKLKITSHWHIFFFLKQEILFNETGFSACLCIRITYGTEKNKNKQMTTNRTASWSLPVIIKDLQ